MQFKKMADPSAQDKTISIPGKPQQTLSDEAFYLVALAVLLKNQTGETSLRHYLVPADRFIRTQKPPTGFGNAGT